MRILLTNDDGINSPGILLLAAALREAGHRVFVIAPASDRSGISHALSFLNSPCKLTELEQDTWVCDGTPVDCIITGLLGGLPELAMIPVPESGVAGTPPDIIVSGINRGANLGTDIVYSGTAAAARQGALFGIPSLALSLVEGLMWHWDMSVIFAAERLEEMMSFWKPGSFVNVNIPNQRELPSSVVHAFPSFRYYNDRMEIYQAPNGSIWCFPNPGEVSACAPGKVNASAKPEKGSDWDVVMGNNASISGIYIYPVLLESVDNKGRT